MSLRTDYKNDVLNTSVNEERRYEEVTNPDGTKSYRDVTDYTQIGDSFDADLVNAQNAEINAKAPLDSPAFTGNPTAPTQVQSVADDSLATTAFVKSATANLIDPNLRTSGKAADAQATGNRISSVNAELVDIRVMTNGQTAATAGDAVRTQISDLVSNVGTIISENKILLDGGVRTGYINGSGEYVESGNNYSWYTNQKIDDIIQLVIGTGFRALVQFFDSENRLVHSSAWYVAGTHVLKDNRLKYNAEYINLRIQTVPIGTADLMTIKNSVKVYRYGLNDLDAPLLPAETDLDEYVDSAFFRLGQNFAYVNSPVSGSDGLLHVVKTRDAQYTLQVIRFYNQQNAVYVRWYSGDPLTWSAWVKTYDKKDADAPLLPNGSDLDSVVESSINRLGVNYTYTNSPVAGCNALLRTIKTKDAAYTVQLLQYYDQHNAMYIRWRSGVPMTWKAWVKIYDKSDLYKTVKNEVLRLVDYSATAPARPNVGTKIRVMSYNVAKYNKDTTTYMNTEKMNNFRKMLGEVQPDLIALQEGVEFADGSSKAALNYLYYPVFPFARGTGAMQCISKYEMINGGLVRLTDDQVVNRDFRWCTLNIDSKTVLFCSAHPIARHNGNIDEPVDSAASIADRKREYGQIFKWVNREIDLAYYADGGYDPTKRRYAPEADYIIIGGDWNTCTTEDQNNLTELVEQYSFSMGNGQRIGWVWTNRNVAGTTLLSLDNVVCSSNVIINGFTAYQGLYEDLYSDHVPVAADITLL